MQNRNRLTGIENKLVFTKEEREGGRDTQGHGINRCKLLYTKYISNKDILYSTGNYTHCLIITYKVNEVALLCPTLCDPMDCMQPTRLLCPWNSPGQTIGVSCHSLLQGIFPTHVSNPGLPYCRQILYHLEPPGKPVYILCTYYYIVCTLSCSFLS